MAHDQVQNVRFEWKPQHILSENFDPRVKVSYQLELFEIIPNKDLSTTLPDWTHTTTDTHYTLTANDFPLQTGKKYAWQIKVITDQSDKTYFNNDGYSEIAVFEYQ